MKILQISDLEKARESAGLKQADLARLFDVPPQNYNNWVYRNSVPKEHTERAFEVLDLITGGEASSQLRNSVREKVNQLRDQMNEAELEAWLRGGDAILGLRPDADQD